MATLELDLATPKWALPLLPPMRYKGAKGGRSSGKSHFFAELAVEEMVTDPSLRFVCIREVQRSLKFSAKSLVENKIAALGVSHLFTVLEREIRRNGGTGVMIFEGMQDHTADSLKSLEAFGRAWCEEAQALSRRSLALLLPTIREPGSQIWFSWNPDQPDDPVDELFRGLLGDRFPERGAAVAAGAALVHVNYDQNPFCPQESKDEAARLLRVDPDAHAHIWLGQYNTRSDALVLAGKWVVDEFEPYTEAMAREQFGERWAESDVARGMVWDGPYHGGDFGFAQDPNVLVRCWTFRKRLYVERVAYRIGEDTDKIPAHWQEAVPGCEKYVIRADSARPETISYLKRHGFPHIVGVEKWQGSVEDGIAFLRQFEKIVIHTRCTHAADEARHWSYKVDKKTGDVMPELVDGMDHVWDAVRYALAPLIKERAVVTPWAMAV